MYENSSKGPSLGSPHHVTEMDEHTSVRRSISPRPVSRIRTSSQSPSNGYGADGRNGRDSKSLSRTRSQSRTFSRSRSRTRDRGRTRSRSRSYSRSLSPPRGLPRSSKIVIEKLTKNVTESHLLEIFGGFGEIQSLDIPMNGTFMTNRGTAYVLYYDPADAEAAIAHMHEAQLDGAILNVSIVFPKRAFSRSPPPPQDVRGGRQRQARGQPMDRASRPSPYSNRSPPRRYGRSRPTDRHDLYRPRSISQSRSRSPRRSRSFSSRSPSVPPPRRRARARNESPRRHRRRSPSYSSYDYSSRSRSASQTRGRNRYGSRR